METLNTETASSDTKAPRGILDLIKDKKKFWPILVVGLFILGLGVFSIFYLTAKTSRPPTIKISSYLYGGAAPTEKDFQGLIGQGFQSVINFRSDKTQVNKDRKMAEALGLKYSSIPWPARGNLDVKTVKDFFSAIESPRGWPVFMYGQNLEPCLVMGVLYYQVKRGLPPDDAYQKVMTLLPAKYYSKTSVKEKLEFFRKALASS